MIIPVSYNRLQITEKDFSSIFLNDIEARVLKEELSSVILSGKSIIDTQGLYKIFNNITVGKNYFVIEDIVFDCGRKIASQLYKAEKIAVFVCTAGNEIFHSYKQYVLQNDPLKAYFVDTMGSIAVEKAMDVIQQKLVKSLQSKGLKITNRYSPGYCGWQIKEQGKLFSLLPENPCGITLNESSLMIPSKSISGVIGIGNSVSFSQHECKLCELEKCIYRKK